MNKFNIGFYINCEVNRGWLLTKECRWLLTRRYRKILPFLGVRLQLTW